MGILDDALAASLAPELARKVAPLLAQELAVLLPSAAARVLADQSILLSPTDVARRYRIRDALVYDAVKSGDLPATCRNRRWSIRRAEADQWAVRHGLVKPESTQSPH